MNLFILIIIRLSNFLWIKNYLKKSIKNKKLEHFVPRINSYTDNFYSYDFVPGELLSKQIDLYKYFNFFLSDCKRIFGKRSN